MSVPALAIALDGAEQLAVNDLAVRAGGGRDPVLLELGVNARGTTTVACDGLLVCTPIGSTGYNLAAGGPLCSWRAGGAVLSILAPRSLAARSVVLAVDDMLVVRRKDAGGEATVEADGAPVGRLITDATLRVSLRSGHATLAALPDTTVFDRLHAKFGWLRPGR